MKVALHTYLTVVHYLLRAPSGVILIMIDAKRYLRRGRLSPSQQPRQIFKSRYGKNIWILTDRNMLGFYSPLALDLHRELGLAVLGIV